MNFSAFTHKIKAANRAISESEASELLHQVEITDEDLAPYLIWNEAKYQRNEVFRNEHSALYIMTWLPGQFTAIHNHKGSLCGMRVLQGDMTEIRYKQSAFGSVYPYESETVPTGSISVAIDEETHQVGNLHKNIGVVTLHLYTPPRFDLWSWFEIGETWFNGYDRIVAGSKKATLPKENVIQATSSINSMNGVASDQGSASAL